MLAMQQNATTKNLLHATNLHKHYRLGSEDLHVLRGVDATVDAGEWLGGFGASGAGKSTLLHLMGGLDTPDQGRVLFQGRDLFEFSQAGRDRFRNRNVGFVFQFYHLLPELNVLENTVIASMINESVLTWPGASSTVKDRAAGVLDRLGLSERLKHRPSELSGGERQRVAIARALINEPVALLADEPTGNLDRRTGQRILDLFGELHAEGQTIVMVTHDRHVADRADRLMTLVNGRLSEGDQM